ncbi:MAG: hypothetical protein IJQ97_00855, partial [Paludibacteraceae bacterium]|nr:hypothetical protein [Paludibacteraceae bacterium]
YNFVCSFFISGSHALLLCFGVRQPCPALSFGARGMAICLKAYKVTKKNAHLQIFVHKNVRMLQNSCVLAQKGTLSACYSFVLRSLL